MYTVKSSGDICAVFAKFKLGAVKVRVKFSGSMCTVLPKPKDGFNINTVLETLKLSAKAS